ncbi:MAG: penicillin-binding transpeptidase domain-containing protein [Eubacteriales bacterium]|nr:penicillin-binding transpeptidase domain-containing protein [Eubacteriales bacterium]
MKTINLKKQCDKLLLLFIVLVMGCCLVACEANNYLREELKREQTATATEVLELPDPMLNLKLIIEDLELDQPEELYHKVHPDALRRFGREQIVDRHKKIHADLGITEVRLSEPELISEIESENKLIYRVVADLRSQLGTISKPVDIELIYNAESGRWELNWRPNLIIPALHERGTVRMRRLDSKRGQIFDCKGRLLAENSTDYQIGMVAANYSTDKLQALADFLELDADYIERSMTAEWVREDIFVPLKRLRELPPGLYQELRNYQLQIELEDSRTYPYGPALANLIGYVGKPSAEELAEYADQGLSQDQIIGKTGLEQLFEERLSGRSGFQVYITGSEEEILIEEPMIPPEDIHLTIDAEIQKKLYEHLTREANDSFVGVLMRPEDGSILALLSTPSYDPELFMRGISTTEYQELLDNPALPLFNKFNVVYTPGSTHKVPSALSFLSTGEFDFSDKIKIEGKSWQLDASWGDYEVVRVEQIEYPMNLEDALVYSDNIFFARTVLKIGLEKYLAGLEKLGFGQEFKTAYPFKRSHLTSSGTLENKILLADTAYGQGELQVAPVELAAIYAAVLGAEIPEPKLLIEEQFPPRAKPDLTVAERSALARSLRAVVKERYAKAMERKGLKIAGKSGTAELGLDKQGKMQYNSWFVGYDQARDTGVFVLGLFNAQDHKGTYCHQVFADCMEILAGKKPKEADSRGE